MPVLLRKFKLPNGVMQQDRIDEPERIERYLKLFEKEDVKKLQTGKWVWIEKDEWKLIPDWPGGAEVQQRAVGPGRVFGQPPPGSGRRPDHFRGGRPGGIPPSRRLYGRDQGSADHLPQSCLHGRRRGRSRPRGHGESADRRRQSDVLRPAPAPAAASLPGMVLGSPEPLPHRAARRRGPDRECRRGAGAGAGDPRHRRTAVGLARRSLPLPQRLRLGLKGTGYFSGLPFEKLPVPISLSYVDRWTKKRNGLSQIRRGTNSLIAASNSFCLNGLRNVRWGPSTLAAVTDHPSNFLEYRIQFRQTK